MNPQRRPLILDVDTGSDDALAILTALLSPEYFEVLGICTVHGNRPLPNTTENTLRVVQACSAATSPSSKGAPSPLWPALTSFAACVPGPTKNSSTARKKWPIMPNTSTCRRPCAAPFRGPAPHCGTSTRS